MLKISKFRIYVQYKSQIQRSLRYMKVLSEFILKNIHIWQLTDETTVLEPINFNLSLNR